MNNINKYWEVHLVVEIARNGYRALESQEFNSINKQMIPLHGRFSARLYIKNKPSPVGIKSFVRCGNPVKHMTLNFTKDLVHEFHQSILT